MLMCKRFHTNAYKVRIEHFVNVRHVNLSTDLYCSLCNSLPLLLGCVQISHVNVFSKIVVSSIVSFTNVLFYIHMCNSITTIVFSCVYSGILCNKSKLDAYI